MIDTKALRQKVLDLAIRGKLVPQDPNDEPASVLLERIRAQKQQMVKDGKLKAKDIKNDTVIFVGEDNLHYEKFADGSIKCIEDEIPFDLPDGWEWTRLGYISSSIQYGLSDSAQTSGTHRLLRITDIQNGKVNWETVPFTTVENPESYILKKGDIVFARTGATVGKSFLLADIPFDSVYASYLIRIRLYDCVLPEYIYQFFNSNQYWDQITDKSVGVGQPNCNGTSLKNLLLPLASFSEQKRIVPFANDLISLVSDIESERDDFLDNVAALKSKILDLAIRGQLVPQNPTYEPAPVLLDRIRAEKEKFIKAGKIKRDKKESVIFKGEDNSYYLRTGDQVVSIEEWNLDVIPESWALCCLGEVCDYGNCINVETDSINDTDWILDLEDIEKDSGRVLKKVIKKDRNANSTKHRFHKGQVLYSKLRPYLNKVVLADDDGYCTSEILPLEFSEIIVPEYARYYLMSPTFLAYADRCSYGVKMPRLGTSDGKKAVLAVPPVDEQKRIAEAIKSAFEKLSNIEAMLE